MTTATAPHVPVMLGPLLAACAPIEGHWIDGTLGAGGYARALLEAGATRVTGLDKDPLAHDLAADWGAQWGERLATAEADFATLEAHGPADGVCLDLGVSSMQLDRAERGFSFSRSGPLDMRMGREGPSAADLVNALPEAALADVLHTYGEERAARRIARAIARERQSGRIEVTARLADIIASCLPRPKPGQTHPATRSFQALRIAVNDELGSLAGGLQAAERALAPGGRLAVVTFHSVEDRIVKRFLRLRSGTAGAANRHAPEAAAPEPGFVLLVRGEGPGEAEVAANPRARSARLRVARRTDAPAVPVDPAALGVPQVALS